MGTNFWYETINIGYVVDTILNAIIAGILIEASCMKSIITTV